LDRATPEQFNYAKRYCARLPQRHHLLWINGLDFDRHEEETAVDAFTKAIRFAAERFLEDPLGAPLIPNWNRVTAAFPNFFDQMIEAVTEDNQRSETGTA
jgi:glucosyl-3-phosphoglycerate synthase